MSDLIEKLNVLIKDEFFNYNKILNKRKNKVSFKSVLEYAFLYSNINKTKEICKAETNINNNIVHSRSSYERNFKKIPIDFFINFYNKIKLFYDSEIKFFKNITDMLHNNEVVNEFNLNDNKKINACDGICSNNIKNNKLYTNLDVFSFDVIEEIPLNIMDNVNIEIFNNNVNNKSNKNHETTILNNFIENNNDIKNTIFIADRLYSTYTVINNLEINNLNYIIRLKENLDIIGKKYIDIDKIKNLNKSNTFNNKKIRIIEYYVYSTEIVKNKTKSKELKIKIKQKYYLITNLSEVEYPNKLIEILYKYRWKIEIYFKSLKNNFKFDAFYLKDKDEILKLKYIEMIIFILNKMCYVYCLNKNKNKLNTIKEKKSFSVYNKDLRYSKNKKKRDEFIENKYINCTSKVNLSLSFDGFYKLILHELINENLTEKILKKYNDNYLQIIKNETNRTFKRESIMPYSKWYIKKYHKTYELKKIVNAIIKDKIEDLNKNLKLKAKDLMENIKDKTTFVKLKDFLNIS